ncbi:PAS domain-containing sensor histidine kinase [Rhodobacteraceae bacterium RKSG542]|nr:PAS domain-containing sensor histidine kinase [Pseudovibrio flavus]
MVNLLAVGAFAMVAAAGFSQATDILPAISGSSVNPLAVMWLAAMAGAIAFAVTISVVLVRYRRRASEEISALQSDKSNCLARIDKLESLIETDDSLMLIWEGRSRLPLVAGYMSESSEFPDSLEDLLDFGSWLDTKSAEAITAYLDHLRNHGESFKISLGSLTGTYFEATGRTAGGAAVLRLRDLTGDRQVSARIAETNRRQQDELTSLRRLLDQHSAPVWQRNGEGRLTWVNDAYVDAVEAASVKDVVENGIEFLDEKGRRRVSMLRQDEGVFSSPLPVVAAGERRVYEVTDVKGDCGSAGLTLDISELERVQKELRRTLDSHTRTLDELQTAVAIFGTDHKLQFFNAAYRDLWELDPVFLESKPSEGAVLDAMRAARRLPEQADYRSWRNKHLECYQSLEPKEFWWYLPDGRTLRVIANPQTQGGVTYTYENVTEQLDLESRYNALSRVQGETLDHLSEAVAGFGSDGRLRLWNPAFANTWGLDAVELDERPHISALIEKVATLFPNREVWQELSGSVTGLIESRTARTGRMERNDGNIVDFGIVPMPDGGTMLTFVNVTDSVNVERALVEKNDALQEADQLKNAFIQHVSYELRSPLTTIIGFAQLLGDPKFGELSQKQSEYTDYILSSSSSLLAIINDILDLTTIDAGIMELDISEVDVSGTVVEAVEGLKDRIAESHLTLKTHVPTDIGSFKADERRLRQVLFNLISNAIRYSREYGLVEVFCERHADMMQFRVEDHGIGISGEMLGEVFARFVGKGTEGNRQGVGLGLSIVKSFVELHGGTVEIASEEGVGTTVTCNFPLEPRVVGLHAAE